MSVNLSPIGNGFQFLTTSGTPLSGGLIYTYQAGSSTPLATYTDNGGTIACANPIVLGSDGRPTTEIWLTYGYNYKFVLKDSTGNTIQTYDNLYGILGTIPAVTPTLPSGMILLWSGATGSIPSGYLLCDGSNGTPDLRNRFVVGAGSSYAVSATGGSTDAIVVSHTHTATSTVTDPTHSHTFVVNYMSGSTARQAPGVNTGQDAGTQTTASVATGITVATTNATSGVSGTNANLPPYYALAYIMKS
jgi:hypothetical protein